MNEQQLARERLLKIRLKDISKEAENMGLSIDSLMEVKRTKYKKSKPSKIKRYINVYLITFPISFLLFFKHIPYDRYFGRNFDKYLIGTLFLSLAFNYLISLSIYLFITKFLPWYRALKKE